jgi:hypothetical protein
MKFEIKNRRTGAVQYACELTAEVAGKSYGFQLGFAVMAAHASNADLRGADLSGADLSGAVLSGAVLRNAVLRGADLRGAVLRNADLSGAVLRNADLRGADLSGADLSGAVLSGAVLRNAVLRNADLSGSDLRGSDLSGAVLRNAVLRNADLSGSDLRGSDLSGAVLSGSDWIPKIENIHVAVLAAASNPGALDMNQWHTCDTTHCRAGWVVTLAGDGGRVLEGVYGTAAAAALIYQASDPTLECIPDFYCTNDDAMADMARLAGMAAQS